VTRSPVRIVRPAEKQPSRVVVDGRPATPGDGWDPAITTYGHFTAMQVRARRTRGLDLHLRRLEDATRELFGRDLDAELVRRSIRLALADDIADASVRVYVFHTEREPSVMVTAKPPQDAPSTPQRLRSVRFQRPLAHVKHLGGFRLGGVDAQTYFRQQVQAEGFDEALLTGPDGVVSEGAITNVGFLDGSTVVWPDAPALAGITMQLVQRGLTNRAVLWLRAPVRMADIRSFDGAFLTNSHGVWAANAIDDWPFDVDAARMASLLDVYEAVSWDEI